ncbi:MAG TPA: extracellular solute-binding protein, partial [Chloroflexi bacterium]|nr:extracellular solute-binding protein [Chloroflexota bacterium]
MNKRMAFALAVVLVVSLLAACAPKTVTVTVEVPVERTVEVEKTVEVPVEVPAQTLVLSSEMFAPPAEQEFFINEILKPFEEETGITVNFQVIKGEDLFDRVTVQQQTGHVTTDLVLVFNGRFSWWTDAGYVMPLDEVVSQWTDRTILPAFDRNAVVDGTRYFVPISADVYLTIANNKALDYLPEGASIDSLTYEQYADWAVAIAEGEGEGKVCVTGV